MEVALGPSHIGSIGETKGQVPLTTAIAHQLADDQPWVYVCFLGRGYMELEWLCELGPH